MGESSRASTSIQLVIARQGTPTGSLFPGIRRIFLTALVSILTIICASCGNLSAQTKAPSGTPTPTGIPAGTVLFQSDWTHGLADWQPTKGWTQVNGVLQSSTSQDLSLTIPYQPHVSTYAVEFRVLVVNVLKGGGYFALAVSPSAGRDGYRAAVDDLLPFDTHRFALHPQINVAISPATPPERATGQLTNQVLDYEHDWIWRTYRVEVVGNYATIWVDGHRMSYTWSANTKTLSTGPLQFECGLVEIRVSGFRVIAL
jgi:hypothetical protein